MCVEIIGAKSKIEENFEYVSEVGNTTLVKQKNKTP